MPSRPASRLLISLLAAAAGGVLHARPTGVGVLDVLWSGAFVGALTYVSVTASRLHLLAAAGLASALAHTGPSLATAVAATVLGALHAGRRRADPRLSALTGALFGLSLLTGSGPEDDRWVQALTTTALAAFVVAMGLSGMSRRRRRRIRRWAAGVLGVLVLCALAGGIAALRARTGADAGVEAFRDAQRAASGADLDAAVEAFGDAEASFDEAGGSLAGIGRLGRLVPGLGQQLGAADVAVDAAEEAAEAARRATGQIDLDAIGVRDGAVDLEAVRAAEAPVGSLVETLVHTIGRLAGIERGFLVAPVSDALDEALSEARDAGAAVDRLHRTIEVVPSLLGIERPVRYLVLFTSPVEARGRFGFPASYAVLRADGGRVTYEGGGGINDLNPETPFDQLALRVPPRAQPYLQYGVARDWRSLNIPAHAPAAADLATQLALQSGIGPIDGVAYADPETLATLVALLGDVPLPEVGATLTEANTVDFLTRQQYLQFPELGEQQERRDLLQDVAQVVGERLPTLSLPRARDVVDRFGPLVAGRHLVLSVPETVAPDAADLLADVGLDGGFPGPGDGDADVLLVTQLNSVGNKIDLFLKRSLTYDVVVDEDGRAETALTVELTNDVPAGRLPPYFTGSALEDEPPPGTNISTTFVYSRYPLEELTVDGQPVLAPVFAEGGVHVYQVTLTLAPGQTVTIEGHGEGEAVGPAPYEVRVEPGGLLTPDAVTVTVRDERVGDEVARTLRTRRPGCVSLRPRDQRCG